MSNFTIEEKELALDMLRLFETKNYSRNKETKSIAIAALENEIQRDKDAAEFYCASCDKTYEFNKEFKFCPYCGGELKKKHCCKNGCKCEHCTCHNEEKV